MNAATDLVRPEKVDGPTLPSTEGWPTREQVTDMLQCTAQTIKNYEERKLLHPREALRRDRRGNDRKMLVYDPKELAALPFRNRGGNPKLMVHEPGEQAARAFEMFRRGDPLDDVVIELRISPERVEDLYERWERHSKARLIITPPVRAALEQIFGPFAEVKDLIERANKLKQQLLGKALLPPTGDTVEDSVEEDRLRTEELHGNIRAALQSGDPLVARVHELTGGSGWAVIVEWQSTPHYACTLAKAEVAEDTLELAVRGWFVTTFPDLPCTHLQIQGPLIAEKPQ